MAKMFALKSFPYAGKRLKVGDPFETRNGSDARLLKAIGKATEAPPEPPPAPPAPAPTSGYRRRDVAAEAAPAPPPASASEPAAEKPKRTYKRRDLVAE